MNTHIKAKQKKQKTKNLPACCGDGQEGESESGNAFTNMDKGEEG